MNMQYMLAIENKEATTIVIWYDLNNEWFWKYKSKQELKYSMWFLFIFLLCVSMSVVHLLLYRMAH